MRAEVPRAVGEREKRRPCVWWPHVRATMVRTATEVRIPLVTDPIGAAVAVVLKSAPRHRDRTEVPERGGTTLSPRFTAHRDLRHTIAERLDRVVPMSVPIALDAHVIR